MQTALGMLFAQRWGVVFETALEVLLKGYHTWKGSRGKLEISEVFSAALWKYIG